MESKKLIVNSQSTAKSINKFKRTNPSLHQNKPSSSYHNKANSIHKDNKNLKNKCEN